MAVQVGSNGRAMDAETSRQLADARTRSVGVNEVVDVGGGEASLGRV